MPDQADGQEEKLDCAIADLDIDRRKVTLA